MKFLQKVWNKLSGWFRVREKRLVLTGVAIAGTVMLASTIGGVILTATVVVLATYIGTLITLSRIPDKMPTGTFSIKKMILAPFVMLRNFLFNHHLITTVAIGLMAGAIVGYGTVTGFVVLAIVALLGDLLVLACVDAIDVIKQLPKQETALEVA